MTRWLPACALAALLAGCVSPRPESPASEGWKTAAPRDEIRHDAREGLQGYWVRSFPEVARRLTLNGAEVIAWPVWECNPLLARARRAKTTCTW